MRITPLERTGMLVAAGVVVMVLVARAAAAPTDPDPTFAAGATGPAGMAVVPTCAFIHPGGGDIGRQSLAGNAGKLVLEGNFGSASNQCFADVLTRFTSDGRIDTSFGTDGYAIAPAVSGLTLQSMAVSPDDSIYVLGWDSPSAGNYQPVLARYTPEGVLDPSFGSGGIVTVGLNIDPRWLQLAVQGNGGVVVAAAAVNDSAWYLSRTTPSGALDPEFGSGGTVTYSAPAAQGDDMFGPSVVNVQSDSSILVAGDYFASTAPTGWRSIVVRFGPDGSIDPTFGAAGVLANPVGASSGPSAIAVSPDDSLTVAATSADGSHLLIAHYDADGKTRDPAFNSGLIGSFALPGGEVGSVVSMILTDQGLVGSGTTAVVNSGNQDSPYSNPQPFLLGLTASGSADLRFGPDGLLFESDIGEGTGLGLVTQPDGKFVQAGTGVNVALLQAGTGANFAFVRRFLGSSPGVAQPSGAAAALPTGPPQTVKLASNTFRLLSKRTDRRGDVLLALRVPGPGSLETIVTRSSPGHRRIRWARSDFAFRKAGIKRVRVTPSRADQVLLRRHRTSGSPLSVRVCVGFTPNAGYTATRCMTVRLLAVRGPAA